MPECVFKRRFALRRRLIRIILYQQVTVETDTDRGAENDQHEYGNQSGIQHGADIIPE